MISTAESSNSTLYPDMVGLTCIYCNYVFEPLDNPLIKRFYDDNRERPILGYFGCRKDCHTSYGHVFGNKRKIVKTNRRSYY